MLRNTNEITPTFNSQQLIALLGIENHDLDEVIESVETNAEEQKKFMTPRVINSEIALLQNTTFLQATPTSTIKMNESPIDQDKDTTSITSKIRCEFK